ncbi:MAG TPA: class I SAM-dependent methyltransferase, partial [Burkholderiales bacterium]|nr:class I SAM-dependent methyltransferase [Burkholderiales bacterium]
YLPAMVESVRRQYPSVDVRLGDARNLSAFADATFRLVAFSNRGIDAVSHEDRRCILAEAYRVLEPGGIFWFSTLNKDGEVPRLRPWSPRLPWLRPGVPRRFGHLLRTLRSMPRGTLNYYRSSSARAEGDGWLTAPFYAHNFGLIVHYTTLGSQIAELQQAGFRGSVEVYDDESGARIRAGEQLGRVPSFDILASK